jgi:uncharacterized membrane protein
VKRGAAAVIGPLLAIVSLAYPFAVWLGLERWSPRYLVLLLGLLWLGRLLVTGRNRRTLLPAAAALLFCAVTAAVDDASLLLWYPVLINGALLLVFASSLRGTPVIETLARLRDPALPVAGIAYTRRVTVIWSLFFLLNGAIAAALTLWAPLSWWTLYNGLIAYGLIGLLLGGEWLVRQRVLAT